MPTSTFFRLPQEKRLRLEEAAWAEFTRVSFADASINQIIRAAHIPRGSFYQYFTDKQELFTYLLSDMHEYFMSILEQILDGTGGDLFTMPLAAYDRFVGREGAEPAGLKRCIKMMRINRGMDMQWFFSDNPCVMPQRLMEHVNRDKLAQQDEDFVKHAFFLIGIVLLTAIMETLNTPERLEAQRDALAQRIEIIRLGSAKHYT